MNNSIFYPKWNFKLIRNSFFLATLLLSSFLLPWTRSLWDALDLQAFHALNGLLRDFPNTQFFWALGNKSLIDWVGDAIMFLCFATYVWAGGKKEWKERLPSALLAILYIAAVAYFINRILFRTYLEIDRLSPSLCVPDCVHITQYITQFHIKEGTAHSFPGDHATTALSFLFTLSYLASWPWRIAAFIWALFAILPRLVVGAHWLSDILVGSITITLICFSLIFGSPIRSWLIHQFQLWFKKNPKEVPPCGANS